MASLTTEQIPDSRTLAAELDARAAAEAERRRRAEAPVIHAGQLGFAEDGSVREQLFAATVAPPPADQLAFGLAETPTD